MMDNQLFGEKLSGVQEIDDAVRKWVAVGTQFHLNAGKTALCASVKNTTFCSGTLFFEEDFSGLRFMVWTSYFDFFLSTNSLELFQKKGILIPLKYMESEIQSFTFLNEM